MSSQMLSVPPHALPPAIDAARLEEATGGDAEFCAELLDTFLEDATVRVEALALAIAEQRISTIIAESHTIKGASANVGADRMRDLASRIEAAARRGDSSQFAADVAKLSVELARVRSSR